MSTPPDTDGLWIHTEPSADGSTYVVTISFTEDRALTLTPDAAGPYAATVLAAAQRAEHDAAVFTQLRKRGLDTKMAAGTIVDLREDRPDLDHEATAPMMLDSGVTGQGKPFLTMRVDGRPVGQLTPRGAREHAQMALEAVTAADLDAAYYRYLAGTCRLPEPTARAAVQDLADHRDTA